MQKRKALEVEPSSGNVFADLGLADADEHLIKAGLVVKIDRIIRQRHLTQAAAAQLIGIDQPKVSAMLAGQFRGCLASITFPGQRQLFLPTDDNYKLYESALPV